MKGYIRDGIFPIDVVLSQRGQPIVMFGDKKVRMMSTRYSVFAQSLSCAFCGLTGIYFALEKCWSEKTQKADNKIQTWHFNLYAINENGHEIMMTQDHIIPRCFGGGNLIENLRTMCYPCNHRRGNGSTKAPTKNGVSPEDGWNSLPSKNRKAELRLFRRNFARVFLANLGWNKGSTTISKD